MKLREGNVFTGVCDSIHRAGECLPGPRGGVWSGAVVPGLGVPGPGGAWWRPPRRLLLRAVRILLEYILVK